MPRKFLAKKISKKIKSNYGVPMEDVLKKENYPKKDGGEAKKVPKYWVGAAIAAGTALAQGIHGASQAKKQKAEQKKAALSEAQQTAAAGQGKIGKKMLGSEEALKHGGGIKKYRGELKSEVKGMGPEGKSYLKDVFKGKKYEGKLKGKYKGELGKELWGMHKKGKEYLKDLIVKRAEGGWIQGAVKKPGALRAVAAKEGLIKGDQKLSGSDLSKLGSQAKKSGNSLLAKRVSLAKTFAKMRKKK